MKESRDDEAPKDMLSTKANAEMLTFRKLVSRLLNLFMHSRDRDTVNTALSLVLSFLQADRISLRVFDRNFIDEDFSYTVTRQGLATPLRALPEILKEKDPTYSQLIEQLVALLKTGKELVVDNVNQLPAELAFSHRLTEELIRTNETKSCLTLPTYSREVVNGYIMIDFVDHYHTWKRAEIENMRVVCEIFSNTIDHERVYKEREISALKTLKNEVLLNLIFQKLPIGVELYDEKGILTRINKSDLAIFGITEENVVGIVDLFRNPMITEEHKQQIQQGIEVEFEVDYNFKVISENKYYESDCPEQQKRLICRIIPLMDTFDNIFGYLFLVNDISADYQQKRELEYNLTKLRMALDTGKALIWEYDVENNQLSFDDTLTGDIRSWIFMNAGNDDMFTSEGQMQGVHPEDMDRFYNQAVTPILNGEINQVTITYRQYMNGKLEWLTSNFRSTQTKEGKKPSKVFCYTMIVTEQHETELELVKMKEADRLKTVFMENLSHEIRTPLNAIVGFSNILAEGNHTPENEEFIRLIHENNETLLNLVSNMLDLSKLDAGEIEYVYQDFDLQKMGEELYHLYAQKKQSEVTATFHYNLPFTTWYSDEKRMRQIISLLLDNAVKFTQKGEISLSFEAEEEKLKVIVSDTGIGLTEEERKNLFSPFYQSDTFQKGAGLGLHISQKLIKGLGGTVCVESEKDRGSKFWFTLPATNTEQVPIPH
ncbi:ATP-binding protein [Parabacteroides sp. PF5-6]|uniref:sensor histidine kinase n=1 Tax=Parabacteroides sp. PF5-6 TaxID=1742403 RepID=UPI00240698DF|nr:ATP-binding protein [Parabacteroides sp. PF5-6]MDF9829652.1 signal transduction histidine kinase/PAS domain-containing protein [Parabacteroides sp. PF5-6]